MIDGLRTEFPELFALAARVPRPIVPPAGPLVAALYGLGARWLVGGLLEGVVNVSLTLATPTFETRPPIRETAALLAVAAAVSIARRSGGIRGALLVGAAIAGGEIGVLLLRAHRYAVLCPTQLNCPPIVEPPFPWYLIAGAVFGLVGVHLVSASGARWSAPLLAAAVLAVSFPIVRLLIEPFGQPVGADAAVKVNVIMASQLTAAVTAGALLGVGGRRLWLSVPIFVAVYVLPSFFYLRLWLSQRPPQPFVLQVEWQMLLPFIYALGLVTGVFLARMARSLRRIAVTAQTP